MLFPENKILNVLFSHTLSYTLNVLIVGGKLMVHQSDQCRLEEQDAPEFSKSLICLLTFYSRERCFFLFK